MATNKKGFVVYCDLIHTIKKVIEKDRINKTNNAGELFYHVLQYTNDLNPEPISDIIDFLFEPIKQQLKRDLKKWEGISEERSSIGRLGGLKSAEARRNKLKQNEAIGSNVKQNEQVTVKDTVIVKVKEINIPPLQEFLDYSKEKMPNDFEALKKSLELKYASWVENGWKTGHDKKIKNWKATLLNTIQHLPKDQLKQSTNKPFVVEMGKPAKV